MNFKQIVDHVVDNGNIYFQYDKDFFVLAYQASLIPTVKVEAWYRENRTEMLLRYQEYDTKTEKVIRFYDSKGETSNFRQVKEIVDLINESGALND